MKSSNQLCSPVGTFPVRQLSVFVFNFTLLCTAAFGQGVAVSSRQAVPPRPLPPGLKPPEVHLVDLAKQAGLTAINTSGRMTNKQFIVETTGTGVALFDFNNDGLLDIFMVNAGTDVSRNSHRGASSVLYKNLGNLQFTDVTREAGLDDAAWGQGVCAGDINNDGLVDLFVTRWGQNALYVNQGHGRFLEEAKQRGLWHDSPRWSTGCAFFDYDRDGDLDLFVANYLRFDPQTIPLPGESPYCTWKGFPVLCGPRGLPGESMSLYENLGNGVFRDVTKKAGIETPKQYYGFTVLTADFDNDGWIDVYVACDSTPSLLFHNKGGGTFEEIGLYSGAALNEDGQEQAGMGAIAADFNRDGWLDIFKTNFSNDTPNLYVNLKDGTFIEATIPAGLAVHTNYVGWGAAPIDVDHDGWKDIFVVNGHVYPEVEKFPTGETFKQPRLLYWNRRDDQFYDLSPQAGPAVSEAHSSRGMAAGDLDNDGMLELVVVNMHESLSLIKNTAPPQGNFLLLRVLTASGRDAIGARVTVSTADGSQIDEVRSGSYHISQGDFRLHFGLAQAKEATATIRWLSGKQERFQGLKANHIYVIQEGKGIIHAEPFKAPLPPAISDGRPKNQK